MDLALVPIFLWVSDAFLLYRAWVIWIHRRIFILFPTVVFVASVVIGIAWLIQGRNILFDGSGHISAGLGSALVDWIPALSFSLSMDVITTGMIAGRLAYHYKLQRKATAHAHRTSYLPVLVIFIESGALSALSKVVQLVMGFYAFEARFNPIVIPLCTLAANLIILRKALGADVAEMVAKSERLSTIHFQLPSRHAELMTGTIPGGFESHLITVIGGRFDDPDNLPEDSSEAENRLETPSILGDKDYSNTDLQNDDMSEKRRHSFAV